MNTLDARIDTLSWVGSAPVPDPAELAGREADEAARMMETHFATLLVKEMRGQASFFGTGAHEEIYGGWLDQHLGAALAEANVLDLAGQVRTELTRTQPRQ